MMDALNNKVQAGPSRTVLTAPVLEPQQQRQKVASAYYKLLQGIDWDDHVLMAGLKEGLNKFLSNAFLKLHGVRKYHQGNYYSESALNKIALGDYDGLIYEHIVPKQKFIQAPCEEAAKAEQLTLALVTDLLERYWHIAIITKQEDQILSRSMPSEWDGQNIFLRYQMANIPLISVTEVHKFFHERQPRESFLSNPPADSLGQLSTRS